MGKAYDEASKITAEAGEVQVDGPGGIAISFTPAAADETSDRLKRGAQDAQAQLDDGSVPPAVP